MSDFLSDSVRSGYSPEIDRNWITSFATLNLDFVALESRS
jgi:hypothetical protein